MKLDLADISFESEQTYIFGLKLPPQYYNVWNTIRKSNSTFDAYMRSERELNVEMSESTIPWKTTYDNGRPGRWSGRNGIKAIYDKAP